MRRKLNKLTTKEIMTGLLHFINKLCYSFDFEMPDKKLYTVLSCVGMAAPERSRWWRQ